MNRHKLKRENPVRRKKFRIAITILLILISVLGFSLKLNAQSNIDWTTKLDTLVGKEMLLRKSINGALTFYLNDSAGTYYYLDDDCKYLYSIHQKVKIKSVKTEISRVTFSIENWLIGERKLILATEKSDTLTKSQIALFLSKAFIDDPENDEFPYYTWNQQDDLIHATLCNHIAIEHRWLQIQSIEGKDNIRLCKSCFYRRTIVPDLIEEEIMGHQATNYYLTNNQLSNDGTLQSRLDSLGHDVLDKWPINLRGFTYKFCVVNNPVPNAASFPGGFIFVNEGLINMIDSNQELLAVLAHEIAHVEMRHGYRQFRSSQKAAMWSTLALTAMAGAVQASTDNSNVKIAAFEATRAIIDVFAEITIKGYSQEYEVEADCMAQLYMKVAINDSAATYSINVLRKLQYFQQEIPGHNYGSAFYTHPPLSERIERMKHRRFDADLPSLAFEGFDKYGNVVARFTIIASASEEYWMLNSTGEFNELWVKKSRQICYGNMDTYIYMGKSSKVKYFKLKGIDSKFDNEEDTEIIPGQNAGMIFYRQNDSPADLHQQFSLDLPLNNVEEWR